MKKNNPQKEIVIASLEFAREKLLEGEFIDRGDLQNHLLRKGIIKPNESTEKTYLIEALYSQIFSLSHPSDQYKFSKHIMSLEAYMGLLSYEDLEQARKDSAEARKEARTALFWAKCSFWLATVVVIVQIVVSILT